MNTNVEHDNVQVTVNIGNDATALQESKLTDMINNYDYYLVTMVDWYFSWPEAYPVPNKK